MGGKAFDQNGLSTPRMPLHVYQKVSQDVTTKLRLLYKAAESPIEGPGKADYGDVDVIVVAHDIHHPPERETVASVLGAQRFRRTPESQTTHYAVPWPDSAENPVIETTSDIKHTVPEEKDRLTDDNVKQTGYASDSTIAVNSKSYVQVDVVLTNSLREQKWIVFHHGHGDFWNVISNIIAPFGLTATTTGFHLRIEEIEKHDKKMSRVLLSDEPDQVLEFLGFNVQRYWKPFNNKDEMFDYCTSSRFFKPSEKDPEEVRQRLKSNDRQRFNKRPTYASWVDEYSPRQLHRPPGSSAHLSRSEVIEDALNFFGAEVRSNYTARKEEWLDRYANVSLWADIRKSLPIQGVELGFAMNGLKKEIIHDAAGKQLNELTEIQRAYIQRDFNKIKTYALAHCEAAAKQYEADLAAQASQFHRDESKTNPFSKSDVEIFSTDDDERIMALKAEGKTWGDITDATGKRSRSQVQARYKHLLLKGANTKQDSDAS